MKKTAVSICLLSSLFAFAQQTKNDSTKTSNIQEVVVTARKPTIENKVDRTVFNVANSSVVAGNTTWDVLRMAPLVSMDSNDNILAEGESVTVYINDRKTVFKGKELKDYLQTIAADNLMKIEVITTPSARYEATGPVINIVLRKLENEGIKGSVSLTNRQNAKNSQYGSFNLNYHRKNFTETFSGSYGDNMHVMQNFNEYSIYEGNKLQRITGENSVRYTTPSFSTTSEYELNEKNTAGLIFELFRSKRNTVSNFFGENFSEGISEEIYDRNQSLSGINLNLGTSLFYKFYDKEKNKILDINTGFNYGSSNNENLHIIQSNLSNFPSSTRILADDQNRQYYLKADYSQPIGTEGSSVEFGAKSSYQNISVPYDFYRSVNNIASRENFLGTYLENLNSAYINFSTTYFKKLETRIGLRYEHIWFKVRDENEGAQYSESYGTLLPDLLLKYAIAENYDVTGTYKRSIWRPWYGELIPSEIPQENGIYNRGNMFLKPNRNERVALKIGAYKKYFLTASYWWTNQDYWTTYLLEDGKTIQMEDNFGGNVQKLGLSFNTNQIFLKNKLNVNLSLNFNYTDNSDFNAKNNLPNARNYFSNYGGSSNISYTNILNKNINVNGWFGLFSENYGNSYNNKMNFFHNISVTKIFPATQMEASLQLSNPFLRPVFDNTTYTPIGTFRNRTKSDWHGFSLTFIKRFGNQKVKENTKTNVEKDEGGGKG